MNGILCVNKEKGCTSRDVVNEVCKIFNTKKVGHTGTLDPLATGVLVLGINEGTKLIELITSYDKEYEALIRLGIETDTLDITGNIISKTYCNNITESMIDNALKYFNCTYNQEVPKYSAVKINGKKLYQYARNNEDIVLPKREVTIFLLERTSDIKYNDNYIDFRIKCRVSKGTYIRSLIRDIGSYLGVPSTMVELKRTRQGDFDINECYTLENIKNKKYKLKTLEECTYNFKRVKVDDALYKKIINGSIIDNIYAANYISFVTNDDKLLAIYKIYEKDYTKMKPWKMFKTY